MKLNIQNNYFIKGHFEGKYEAKDSSEEKYNWGSASKIKILEGKITKAEKCPYTSTINTDSLSLKTPLLQNIKIEIENFDSNKYQFIEDIYDVLIYNIQLVDIITEGRKKYGTIKGNIFASLSNSESIEYIKLRKEAKPELKIIPPVPTRKIVQKKFTKNLSLAKSLIKNNFSNFLMYLFYALLAICFISIFGPEISLIVGASISVLYFLRKYIYKIFEIIFSASLYILIALLGFGLGSFFLTDTFTKKKDERKEKSTEEINLLSNKLTWLDNKQRQYTAVLKVNEKDFYASIKNKEDIQIFEDNYVLYFRSLYKKIIDYDTYRLNLVYNVIDSIKNKNTHLSKIEFADVIVSMIQNIEYVLPVEGDCRESYKNDRMTRKIVDSGFKCYSNIKYGLFTPLESTGKFVGDCDTRTVMLYALLKKFNYDVVILNSQSYEHSIIGIHLPAYGNNYKIINNKKYYVWETTAPGWEMGVIPPDNSNISKWYYII